MWRRSAMARVAVAVSLWMAAATPSWAQEEVWGYLWELRTARLHPLRGASVQLGRLPQSDVVLNDPRVSRRHAEIRKSVDGGVVVVDRGSTNGSYLDGKRLRPGEPRRLEPGCLLILAYEKLVYHESKKELWPDVIRHSLLGSLVEVRVPVLADRKVKALGRERWVEAVSRAAVDLEKLTVQVSYGEDAVRNRQQFEPGEGAIVGDVAVEEGELRLSLWGLARGGSLVSRRASFSHLKHGELRVGLAAASSREARRSFEDQWSSEGAPFVLELLEAAVGRSNREGLPVALRLARALIEQEGETPARDAARSLAILHRHDPNNPDIPLLAARAEALWVKRTLEARGPNAVEEDRRGRLAALDRAKTWLAKAEELGAGKHQIKKARAAIAEAEKRLVGSS